MKKFSVISLNLKFMRVPVILCLFLSLIFFTVVLSLNVPPLRIGDGAERFFIATFSPMKSSHNLTTVFSFAKLTPKDEKQSNIVSTVSEPVKETENNVQITSKEVKKSPLGEVKVSNSTNQKININSFTTSYPEFLNKDFSVLIVHTHTTESYTPSPKYDYTPSDTDRTLDKNYNMVIVGNYIEKTLKAKGINVYHDSTINDYPLYNGSYNRSSMNISNAIKNDPSIKIVLDVHRDAIEGSNGEKIKYVCDINGKKAASVMLVVGSNLSGLTHNEWEKNMNFAATVQSHIENMYPGLMRPINFRSQRFNQHLAPGGVIVEVGTNGNTLEEALLGAECFADGLADYILENRKK